jgi:hypothetical protein
LIVEQEPKSRQYYRGKYKAFLFAQKVVKEYKRSNRKYIPFFELYNIFKKNRSNIPAKFNTDRKFLAGIEDGLYDVINHLNSV